MRRAAAFSILSIVSAAAMAGAGGARQGVGQQPSPLPLSNAIRERGSSVTGAFEGWYRDKDGSVRFLVGYFNRNTKQELDIPIGPSNRIEPGGPDQGQPTHFLPLRQWGVFTIKVPGDLGTGKLTWTLVSNGQTNVITMHLRPEWIVEPFEDAASKNTPPVLRFQSNGPTFTGPPVGVAADYRATVSEPLEISAGVTDEGPKVNVPDPPPPSAQAGRGFSGALQRPPLAVSWSKFRGPGTVTFEPARMPIDKASAGKATTMASFSEPGEYVVRLQANDQSGDGGGGFQCCWTNAHVKVTVAARTSPPPAR
jgi:hypothetical protein